MWKNMNRNTRKQETAADKVKEIKQRQQNWMKQRAESQQTESKTETNPEPSHKAVKGRNPVALLEQEYSNRSQPSPHDIIASKKSKAKFQNWLKAKQTNVEDENPSSSEEVAYNHSNANSYDASYYDKKAYNKTNYSSNTYVDESYRDHKGSQDVNILRVPSSRPPEFATPDMGWNSDDETGEITAAELLSAGDFDSKADDIIARVKGDLKLKEYSRGNESTYQSKQSNIKNNHGGKPVMKDSKLNENAGAEYSSHVCQSCEQLMVPPDCSPMLLIPCGHTLCGKCCRKTKYCGMCGSPVQSCTGNLMLQQIITSYSSKQSPEQIHNIGQKPNKQNDYREEYQNLVTRQEILNEESNNISRNIQQLCKKLSTEHQQVEHISREEKNIESKIRVLQEQLQALAEHRQEYEDNCEKLQTQTKQEKNRLVLVKETMRSIQGQMEKVRLLAEEGF